jgi:hypothetical protein
MSRQETNSPRKPGLCVFARYDAHVPKTVQIRDIDDSVYASLQRHAAAAGLSVPELLRREATRLAAPPSMEEWLERVGRGPVTNISRTQLLEVLDELRGPWPDAGD